MAKLGGIWNEKKDDEKVYYFGVEFDEGVLAVDIVNERGTVIKNLFTVDEEGIRRHRSAQTPVIATDDSGRIRLVGE